MKKRLETIKEMLMPLYRGWMKFAHVLGYINGTIILTVLFIVLIGPIALVRHFFRFVHWLFGSHPKVTTRWKPKKVRPATIEEVSRFF